MSIFQNMRFRTAADLNSITMRYRRGLNRHPFLLFGLPFMSIIIAASFLLTPITAMRYEKHDRKVRQMTREETMGLHKNSRRVDMREEYYVSKPKKRHRRIRHIATCNIIF